MADIDNTQHTQLVKTRELRLLLGKIGLALPATYNVRPVANMNQLVIDARYKVEDVIKFIKEHLKAKEQNGLYAYNNALLKVIDDANGVKIEIVSKINEMNFREYLNIGITNEH